MAPAQSPESCFVCELNEEFYDLLGDADFRLKARLLLVSRFFEARKRAAFLESLGLCADGMERTEKRMSELNEECEEAARLALSLAFRTSRRSLSSRWLRN